jgi:hypothetical protein
MVRLIVPSGHFYTHTLLSTFVVFYQNVETVMLILSYPNFFDRIRSMGPDPVGIRTYPPDVVGRIRKL